MSQHSRAKNLSKQNTFPNNEGLILSGATLTGKEKQCNGILSFLSLDIGYWDYLFIYLAFHAISLPVMTLPLSPHEAK